MCGHTVDIYVQVFVYMLKHYTGNNLKTECHPQNLNLLTFASFYLVLMPTNASEIHRQQPSLYLFISSMDDPFTPDPFLRISASHSHLFSIWTVQAESLVDFLLHLFFLKFLHFES